MISHREERRFLHSGSVGQQQKNRRTDDDSRLKKDAEKRREKDADARKNEKTKTPAALLSFPTTKDILETRCSRHTAAAATKHQKTLGMKKNFL
jgi:hypothetical protein